MRKHDGRDCERTSLKKFINGEEDMKGRELEFWREQVEIYCSALEEFLNECVSKAQGDLKEIAGAPLVKLHERMDNLRSKYKTLESKK